MEKCFYCKGDLVEDSSNYMTEVGGRFIIIKNVPCQKCTQCGEVIYSGPIIKKIEAIISRLKDMLTEVAIVDYAA